MFLIRKTKIIETFFSMRFVTECSWYYVMLLPKHPCYISMFVGQHNKSYTFQASSCRIIGPIKSPFYYKTKIFARSKVMSEYGARQSGQDIKSAYKV